MRFLLLVLGFVALVLGIYAVIFAPSGAHQNGVLLIQTGAIFFTGGGVALDVVNALKNRNNRA